MMARLWHSSLFFLLLTVCWMGVITYTSSVPKQQLRMAQAINRMPRRIVRWHTGGQQPTGFWRWVDRRDYPHTFDKVYHVIEFAILALLLWRACACSPVRLVAAQAVLITMVIALAFGACDEYHQTFVKGREFSVADLIADAIGIAGMCAACAWARRSKPRRAA